MCNGSHASIQLGYHLTSYIDLLSTKAEPPMIWFSIGIFANQRLNESLRFGMLEIQEHLETVLDKKDHVTEVSGSISEQVPNTSNILIMNFLF